MDMLGAERGTWEEAEGIMGKDRISNRNISNIGRSSKPWSEMLVDGGYAQFNHLIKNHIGACNAFVCNDRNREFGSDWIAILALAGTEESDAVEVASEFFEDRSLERLFFIQRVAEFISNGTIWAGIGKTPAESLLAAQNKLAEHIIEKERRHGNHRTTELAARVCGAHR